jgi:hypothetical protein
VAETLRSYGHEVDCFCDPRSGRYVFHWSEFFGPGVTKEEAERLRFNFDAKSFVDDARVKRAFQEDKQWLDWSEGVVLVVPSGRSAHLEAGYAIGQGKPVWVWGKFPKGEFDVMYLFAQALFRDTEFNTLLEAIKAYEKKEIATDALEL